MEKFLEPFRKMQASSAAMMEQIEKDKTPAKVQAVIKEGWALDITDEEARKILANAAARSDDAYFAIGEVLCPKYTYVGWTTHGHAGGDVPLFAFGPGKPGGIVEAPDIARVCASAMGLDLARLNERLFVDAAKAFADGRVGVDKSDPANPVVKIDYRGRSRGAAGEQELPQAGRAHVPARGRGGVRPGHRPGLHPPAGGPDDPGRKGSPAQDRQLVTQVDRLKAEGFSGSWFLTP